MGELADYLRTLFADPVSILVFVVVFAAVAAAGMRFVSPTRTDLAGPPRSRQIQSRDGRATTKPASSPLLEEFATTSVESIRSNAARTAGIGTNARVEPRHVMGAIHRGLSWILVALLAAATIGTYWASSPGDGSRLLPAVLLMVTVIAGLHLHNRSRRFGNPTDDSALRADFRRTVELDLSNKIAAALVDGSQVRWNVGAPEVHSMDRETIAHARALAAEGMSMDEVCRTIEPEYGGWSFPHQQAFQAVVRAAIEHCN